MIPCSLFGIVWLRSKVVTVEYAISELENRRTERLREAKILLAERASILSMQKVDKAAIKGLGLGFADRTKVVYVKEVKNGPQRASLETKRGGLYGSGSVPLPRDGVR